MTTRIPAFLLACSALCASPALAQNAPSADDIAALRAQIQAMQAQLDSLQAAQATQAAEVAKDQCPVSVLLKPGLESITLDATLG